MKLGLGLFLVLFLVGSLRSYGQTVAEIKAQTPEIVSDENSTPARSVRIDLNTVEGAETYEVHVLPAKKIWTEPWKFQVTNEETFVRLRLSPGEYAVKTRSWSTKKQPGPWSELQYFWVQFRPPNDIYPAANAAIEPKSKDIETLIFEWPKVTGAQWYYFRLKDNKGQLLRTALTKQTYLKSELKVSSEYQWSVMPLSRQDESAKLLENDAQAIYNKFKVLSAPDNTRGTLVKVAETKKTFKYQFEVVKIKKDGSFGEPSMFDSYEPQMRFRLPPSQYEARVRSIFEDKSTSEWSAPFRFFIKRYPPVKLEPNANAAVESTDDVESKVVLKWQKDPEAASYVVSIFNNEDQIIYKKQTDTTELEVRLPHHATYRWMVKSFSKREPAAKDERPDETAQAFTINEYIKLNLGVAEESSQAYGWLRHISSVADYRGQNYDNNAIVTQTLFTGEGEMAAGYWSRRNKLGILAHASLAGFLLQGQNYTYANYGVHGGYRRLLDNGARLRLWLGATYQELPEILTHPFTNEINVKYAKNLGPQLQISYLQQVYDKLGWHAYTSAFLSSKDMGSPNGLSQNPTWSYKFGVQGIYKASNEHKWMVGYTYKVDQVSYKSTDPVNLPNTASLTGHYLNLTYEFAFEEPTK